jgi:hypothetical protein
MSYSDTERTLRVLFVCLTVLALALMAVIYQDCRETENRRAECMKQHSPADCKILFPASGDRR